MGQWVQGAARSVVDALDFLNVAYSPSALKRLQQLIDIFLQAV